MVFDNQASTIGFVPAGFSLDEVIAKDTLELEQIGGSFESIADRMDYLIDAIVNSYLAKRNNRQENIAGLLESMVRGARRPVPVVRYGLIPGEKEIEVVNVMQSKGLQECPFTDCGGFLSSQDYIIRNIRTGRQLWINGTTSHLARKHHLLEKGNEYGISAKDFYVHFMLNTKK